MDTGESSDGKARASSTPDLVSGAEASLPDPPDVAVLRREVRDLRRKLQTRGAIGDLIVRTVEDVLAGGLELRLPKRPRPDRRKKTEEVAVAHLSDTQIGKVTRTYDTAMAVARITEFGERVADIIEHRRRDAKIERIHLYLGGDMVEGELVFPGQAHVIDNPVVEQATRSTPEALARLVLRWLEIARHVHVVAVAGNHGRPASKHAGSHPRTNWDTVAYRTMQTALSGVPSASLSWNVPDDFLAVDEVLGHVNLIEHGDLIRGGFGGFPWYGVGRRIAGLIDSAGEEWNNLYFGHFHTYTSSVYNLRQWFCNGTTESDNDYARAYLAACGLPVQRLQFFTKRRGLVADYPVRLFAGLEP